jgi:hypothetical protein
MIGKVCSMLLAWWWFLFVSFLVAAAPAVNANTTTQAGNAILCAIHISQMSLQRCHLLCHPPSQASHRLCHPNQASEPACFKQTCLSNLCHPGEASLCVLCHIFVYAIQVK